MRFVVVALALALLGACNRCSESDFKASRWGVEVDGARICADPIAGDDAYTASFTDDEMRERIKLTVSVGTDYWGGTPADMDGWHIYLHAGKMECWPKGDLHGCTNVVDHTIDIDAGEFLFCPEAILAHEAGHALHDDPFHWRAGWGGVEPGGARWSDVMPWQGCGDRTHMDGVGETHL